MKFNALSHALWRALGGVVGVVALIGLAISIGWVHQHIVA